MSIPNYIYNNDSKLHFLFDPVLIKTILYLFKIIPDYYKLLLNNDRRQLQNQTFHTQHLQNIITQKK